MYCRCRFDLILFVYISLHMCHGFTVSEIYLFNTYSIHSHRRKKTTHFIFSIRFASFSCKRFTTLFIITIIIIWYNAKWLFSAIFRATLLILATEKKKTQHNSNQDHYMPYVCRLCNNHTFSNFEHNDLCNNVIAWDVQCMVVSIFGKIFFPFDPNAEHWWRKKKCAPFIVASFCNTTVVLTSFGMQ